MNTHKRPSSISELAARAKQDAWDGQEDLKFYLKQAERYRKQGRQDADEGKLEDAFVLFARAATLILERIPCHRDYRTALRPDQQRNLALNGQHILDLLSELKPILVERYERWREAHGSDEEVSTVELEEPSRKMQASPGTGYTTVVFPDMRTTTPAASSAETIAYQQEQLRRQHEEQLRQHEEQRRQQEEQMRQEERTRQEDRTCQQGAAAEVARREHEGIIRRQQEAASAAHAARQEFRASSSSLGGLTASVANNLAISSAVQAASRARSPSPFVPSVSPAPLPVPAPQPVAPTPHLPISYPTATRTSGHPRPLQQVQFESPKAFTPAALPINIPLSYRSSDDDRGEPVRWQSYPPPVTTTSPPPPSQPQSLLYPRMSQHQKLQGYMPSTNSMFKGTLTYPSAPPLPVPPPPQLPPPAPSPQSAVSSRSTPSPQPLRTQQTGMPALRKVHLPRDSLPRFLTIARANTAMNRETCGLLLGLSTPSHKADRPGKFIVNTLLIPRQHSTSDTCTMDDEELVSQFTIEHNLITIGWIHTHPTQSCFMSSVDLHTHSAFQRMLPESFAVVCAPQSNPSYGIFRLTDPPGLSIILGCKATEAFHPHPPEPIYTDADRGHVRMKDLPLQIVDLRL